MISKPLPVLIALICFAPLLWAQGVDLTIEGLKGEAQDNVNTYLSSIPESDYQTSLRFRSRLEKNITKALKAVGYYLPEIEFIVAEDKSELTVKVKQGPVITLQQVDIRIEGEAQNDPQFIALLKNSQLKLGERLNHSQYDALKSSIRNLALQRGYFEGDFTTSRLEVSPERNQAFVHLHYSSGIRYHFGVNTILGSQIELVRVQSLSPYKEGEPYLVSKVGEYNQNLANSDWFSSIFVEPDLTQLGTGRALPMKVALAPQTRNKMETGIGYATDVGVRGSLKWKKPWINNKGHSLDSRFLVSVPEQVITAGYRIPLLDALHDYYQVQYRMKHVDNRDTKSLESSLALKRYWMLDNDWHRSFYIRHLLENYTQGLQDDNAQFVLPGVSFSRSRTRGGLMPSWGEHQSITLEYGESSLLSETRVARFIGATTWIRSAGDNHRGLLRLHAGANVTQEFAQLSPSLRFFAGGDNSLRGYDYKFISPKDKSGALTGAKYRLTSSLEYQYRIYGNWWGAMFYDVGDAFNNSFKRKRGAGGGVRWASPIGPIRLDFAWGLDANKGDEFQIHFTLGPEL